MAFLNENEWIRLNEIAYNISFIYTVEAVSYTHLDVYKRQALIGTPMLRA